jgi:hypothetical protein
LFLVTWWSYPGAAKKKYNKAGSGKRNWKLTMTFTGTLIEDLIATVERAEANTREFETTEIEPWFASIQDSIDYESKLVGVA